MKLFTDMTRRYAWGRLSLLLLAVFAVAVSVASACGDGGTVVTPGPGRETPTSTSVPVQDDTPTPRPDTATPTSTPAPIQDDTPTPKPDTATPTPTPTPASSQSRSFTDDVRRTVEIPATVERIVSIGPKVTEVLVALGLSAKIVGTDDFSYVEGREDLPQLGEPFVVTDVISQRLGIDTEAVAALRPDLVIAESRASWGRMSQGGSTGRDCDAPPLERAGTALVCVQLLVREVGVDGALQGIVKIGAAVGAADIALDLLATLEQRKAAVEQRVAGRPKVKVLLIGGILHPPRPEEPGILVTADEPLNELVELAGGTNVFTASPEDKELAGQLSYLPYEETQAAFEEYVRRNPAAVLVGSGFLYIEESPGWAQLEAVQQGRVLDFGEVGPLDVVDTLEAIAKLLDEAAASAGASSESGTIEVTCDEFRKQADIRMEALASPGGTLEITLCSNATTEFQWEEVQISDLSVLQQVSHEYLAPSTEAVGAAGRERWVMRGLKPGTATVATAYSRPWEGGEKGLWKFTLNVTVGMPRDHGAQGGLPDLEVTGAKIEDPAPCYDPQKGGALGLTVTIENLGDSDAQAFSVAANDDESVRVPGLIAGESTTVRFSGFRWPDENLVVVDVDGEVDENDEENNAYFEVVPIPTPRPACASSADGPEWEVTLDFAATYRFGCATGSPCETYLAVNGGGSTQQQADLSSKVTFTHEDPVGSDSRFTAEGAYHYSCSNLFRANTHPEVDADVKQSFGGTFTYELSMTSEKEGVLLAIWAWVGPSETNYSEDQRSCRAWLTLVDNPLEMAQEVLYCLIDPSYSGCGGTYSSPLLGNVVGTGTKTFDRRGESVSFSGQGKANPGDFGVFEYSGTLTLKVTQ